MGQVETVEEARLEVVLPRERRSRVLRAMLEAHPYEEPAYDLLELATVPGKVFSREQLLERVWGYDYFGDGRLVDVHVRRLRAKLGPEHEQLIGTVRNVGYRFVLPPQDAPERQPAQA